MNGMYYECIFSTIVLHLCPNEQYTHLILHSISIIYCFDEYVCAK